MSSIGMFEIEYFPKKGLEENERHEADVYNAFEDLLAGDDYERASHISRQISLMIADYESKMYLKWAP